MFTGRCQCGSVAFSLDREITDASCCHCSTCQRLTGSAFGAYGAVRAPDFHWTRGSENVSLYRPSETLQKAFCRTCGSMLATLHSGEPGICFVSLGTLDQPESVQLLYHQFVAYKAAWHVIGDSLPQHDGVV